MAPRYTQFDRQAMTRALALAARGMHSTHPNPRVGCVIAQGTRIIAEGWHERAGEQHAEVMALRAATEPTSGATAYVTLEPCSHQGRTPPCADALIDARIGRVVFAMQDPDPRVDGRGAQALRAAGIEVEGGLMGSEAAEINAGYIKRMRSGMPWLRLKLAMSLDGRTALADGRSQWITGEEARADVQQWRARSSAVLTGIGTLLADDPRLDVRLPEEPRRQPLRVVLDSTLRTPSTARLFAAGGEVLIFTFSQDRVRQQALQARGARIERLERLDDAERPPLRQVLARLAELKINEVLVEAGATLAGECVRGGFVDEMLVYLAPMLLGPQARALLDMPELADLRASPRFDIIETLQIGADLRLRLRPN